LARGSAVGRTRTRSLLKEAWWQEQFSEPLKFQTQSQDRFADLAAWIQGHLRQDLSVESLAERACLSPRHFARRFKEVFDTTPATFVEDLRLHEARDRFNTAEQTIETCGGFSGFQERRRFWSSIRTTLRSKTE